MKTNLKFVSIILIGLFLLAFLPTQFVYAEGISVLVADHNPVDPGQTFTVSFNIDQTPGLYGAQFSLVYDNTLIEVVSIQAGSAWPQTPFEAVKTFTKGGTPAEKIEYAATLIGPGLSLSAGALVKITFKAKPVATSKSALIRLGSSLLYLLANSQGSSIPTQPVADLSIQINPVTETLVQLEAPTSIRGGKTFKLDVNVTEVPNLGGIQLSLDYDNTQLVVKKMKTGNIWPNDSFIARSLYTEGRSAHETIEFAATLLNAKSSLPAGTLLEITFEALNPEQSLQTSVQIGSSLVLMLASRDATEIPTAAVARATLTIDPSPAIKGIVNLQANGDLTRLATVEVSNPTIQPSVSTPGGEQFNLAADPGSAYTLVVKAPCYGTRRIANVSAPSVVPEVALAAGDVNGDGLINIADLAAASSQYGRSGVSGCANISGDSQGLVNIQDLSLIALNIEW